VEPMTSFVTDCGTVVLCILLLFNDGRVSFDVMSPSLSSAQ